DRVQIDVGEVGYLVCSHDGVDDGRPVNGECLADRNRNMTASAVLSPQTLPNAHPNVGHDHPGDRAAVRLDLMHDGAVPGREERNAGLVVLRKFGAARALHEPPVIEGADADFLPEI